ncbi:MAG: 1-acyl-sn-glycerol-3-phosphate acyltransferase [Anaerolineae bacterium]|nr:1-acyl-sn-glycerol-3-phosphate acyltransferase [Anaerolineae bacterium]
MPETRFTHAADPVHRPNRPLRRLLQFLARGLLGALTEMEVEGEENFPKSGPLIMVGNHFSFVDPAVFVSIAPWPMDFIGGAVTPHAPKIVQFIPRLWGYLPVYRGTGSTYALKEADRILKSGGVVGIFPEGGSWAQVLRPARPGAALLTATAGAPLLPVGLTGFPKVFSSLKEGKRAKVRIRIGKPFGPFKIFGSRYERRHQLDKIGDEIMSHIAELIPQEEAGLYSKDPKVREAAKGTEYYPWEGIREGQDHYPAA